MRSELEENIARLEERKYLNVWQVVGGDHKQYLPSVVCDARTAKP